MQPKESVVSKPIGHETVIVMECLKATRKGESITIEKISETLVNLRRKNRPEVLVSKCALKQVPGGFYSEDVATFLYYLAQGIGYAVYENDGSFKLLDKAFVLFLRFLEEWFAENPKMFMALSLELEFGLEEMMYALSHRSSQ